MSGNQRLLPALCAAIALATASSGALAQKSKDTLRVAVNEPFPQLDGYHYPQTEASFMYNTIYETLIAFDENKREFVPYVAKSWQRVDDRTIDFEVFDDITFHSGNKLSADDVVYSMNYARDPKVKMPFKGRYLQVSNVEKLGTHKVRIQFKSLFADDMMHLAYRTYMYDSKIHATHADGSDYGRKTPIGTGPYRVVEFDRTAGATLERYAGVKKRYFTRSPIKTVKAAFIRDEQTRLAELFVGNIDMLYNISADNARAIKANPAYNVTAVDGVTVTYLGLDVVGRAGRPELKDPRVRKAVFMSIDREAIMNSIVAGGETAARLNVLCFDSMLTCDYSTKPPAYDPAGAKRLLAEAGLANGFDVTVDTHVAVRPIGEAIAGYLRAVGIRANVNQVLQTVFFKRRSAGEFQMIAAYAPARNFPEATYILDNLFGVPDDDYVRDEKMQAAMKAGSATHDVAKRRAANKIVFDRLNELHAFLPIGSLPIVYAYSKDVRLEPHGLGKTREMVSNVFWN